MENMHSAQSAVPGLLDGDYSATQYGVEIRKPYPSENAYFKANPHVAGMATEDNRIILNPYSTLSEGEKQAVVVNEASRVLMRTNRVPSPQFELSSEQLKKFGSYSDNPIDQKSTVAARILSGDPSALEPTKEQLEYVKMLRKQMGVQ